MKSTSAVPERILTFGLYGSGKTHGWGTLADFYREEGLDNKFYVIGTESGSVGRLSDKYPNFDDNVVVRDVDDWYELTAWTDEILGQVVPGDWIVMEGLDKPWHWVQGLYDKLHGPKLDLDPRDPFSMARGVTEVDRDWVKINAVYRNWINPIVRSDAHVYGTSPQDAIRLPNPQKPKAWSDSKEVIGQYEMFGFRPAGQKELGHHFHSVLWMKHPTRSKWTITTVDDHTREQLHDAEIHNFVLDYLHKVARWDI